MHVLKVEAIIVCGTSRSLYLQTRPLQELSHAQGKARVLTHAPFSGHTGCGGVKAGMQAAVDSSDKAAKGEEEPVPEPGSVADTISKWIAPVRPPSSSSPCASLRR